MNFHEAVVRFLACMLPRAIRCKLRTFNCKIVRTATFVFHSWMSLDNSDHSVLQPGKQKCKNSRRLLLPLSRHLNGIQFLLHSLDI